MDYDAEILKIILYCLGFILFLFAGNIISATSKKKQEKEREQRRRAQEESRRRYAAPVPSRAAAMRAVTWQELSESEKNRLDDKKQKSEAEAARREREKNLPERQRFIAEQRRLMSAKLRYEVMQRDGFRCQLCCATAAEEYKLHVDHIIPVSKGGKTEMGNLRTLCERCNLGKGDRIEKKPSLKEQSLLIV